MLNSPPTTTGHAARGRLASRGRRRPMGPVEDAIKLRIHAGPDAAVRARRALGRLNSDIDGATLESLRLLVTELISNAVRHSGARTVGLMVLVTQPAVRVEVADPGSGFDALGERPGRGAEGGWGLFLVESLADRWGVSREERETRVWFELERRS